MAAGPLILTLRPARRRLAVAWLAGEAPSLLLLVAQARLFESGAPVVAFGVAALLPGLAVVVGLSAATAIGREGAALGLRPVDPSLHRVALLLSVGYGVLVAAVIVAAWLLHVTSPAGRAAFLVAASPWVSFAEALAVTAVAIFYARGVRDAAPHLPAGPLGAAALEGAAQEAAER